jgi:hypothetical protein
MLDMFSTSTPKKVEAIDGCWEYRGFMLSCEKVVYAYVRCGTPAETLIDMHEREEAIHCVN